MNIVISGTQKFQDYNTFMRAVVVAIDECRRPDDNRINIYSVGGYKINQFTAEFVNRSERYLKQKGIKPRFMLITKRDAVEKFDEYGFDMVLFLAARKETPELLDSLAAEANSRDIDIRVYKV